MSTETAGRADLARSDEGRDVLRCHGLGVGYPGVEALTDFHLAVGRGEVVALLGPSGSGKSTLLQAIAGLVAPSTGEIWMSGECVAGPRVNVPAELRHIGMVFQNFALWPHLSVLETVAYPIRRAGQTRRSAREAARDLLQRLDIGHVAERRPAELSGGEQQRTGLARALARDARLYLLDEPTAHLDTHLRAAFTATVLERRAESGAAILYATHDAAEALMLADRVALVVGGRLIQIGSPTKVYGEPVSEVAARLTGPGSVLTVPVAASGPDRLSVDLDGLSVDLNGPISVAGGGIPAGDRSRRERSLLVRPDWIHEGGPMSSTVAAVAFRGPHTGYQLICTGGFVWLHLPGPPRHAVGDRVHWTLNRAWVLPG